MNLPQSDAVKNGWILTARNHKVYPCDAKPSQIHLEDIAHALSMQCRWNGHTRWFYSVAQHCVLASDICPPGCRRESLIHDATEAYMSDVPRPVKAQMPEFKAVEERLMEVIMRRFGLRYPLPPAVHVADNIMLIWEARDLFSPARHRLIFGEAGLAVDRSFARIEPWDQMTAKRNFLRRAETLGIS